MPSTIESIEAAINAALEPGFRGRLIARGQARAMIWRNGQLPAGAPAFSPLLTNDLKSFGFALFEQGLRLIEMGGDEGIARHAFQQAAISLEAVTTQSNSREEDRSFHMLMAAAAYHLGRYSAQAYSILSRASADENFSFFERALANLMLRNFTRLESDVLSMRQNPSLTDEALFQRLNQRLNDDQAALLDDDDFAYEAVNLSLLDNFSSGMSTFLLALERGESELIAQAIELFRFGLGSCAELNLVPQWWSYKIALHLVRDIWATSLHVNLPTKPTGGTEAPDWVQLRSQFLALLLKRDKAEIDLWPSQIASAARAANQDDPFVVSLPTSAGKTRIAELCILRCLASKKRVVFVTPLRALSAQTEVTLQRTFRPLGKRISALYGSIGVTDFDGDSMRESDIVVATPEKLDFALRNDPTLLDDVGLLVFDEGHMIGLNEREVRYEVQIQRLLRRSDAVSRRIVCLSAILPDGPQLEDFANWLTADKPNSVIKSDWRPTRLRFGEVVWNPTTLTGRLNLRVGDERPFVPNFIKGFVPPKRGRTTEFPRDLGELCVASAWRLVQDGQSVLVYCPVRAHVEPFADRILKLHAQGAITSLLVVDESELASALTLGAETLGADSSLLKCLRLGVAIHHGALPTPYRKEIEHLLRRGVLKVTISSPTLAQGLNLSATAVIIHSLFRNQKKIEAPEFRNVIGRAGRAFVDVEGLVLYPIFDQTKKRTSQWEALIEDEKSREMESGLVRLLITLLQRLRQSLGGVALNELAEYVLNQATAWDFPFVKNEEPLDTQRARSDWNGYIASLDTAILSLMGEQEISVAEIAAQLDEVLSSSLWQRRLDRRSEQVQQILKSSLVARTKFIWERSTQTQRRGYFLAGVGLSTGLSLDAIASEANQLLIEINSAILNEDAKHAVAKITALAEKVFIIPPFSPDSMPSNWREILEAWVLGQPLSGVSAGQESETLKFVEGALVYRLPWAMEAIRVRALANGDSISEYFQIDDFDLTAAVPAVETGTLNRSAALLIQAGFDVRTVALRIANETIATFSTATELRAWLQTQFIQDLSSDPNWPTPETHDIWHEFLRSFRPIGEGTWKDKFYTAPVRWNASTSLIPNSPVKIYVRGAGDFPLILSPNGEHLGQLLSAINPAHLGLVTAHISEDRLGVLIKYTGPNDLWLI